MVGGRSSGRWPNESRSLRYLPEAVAIQTAMLGGLNDDELQTLSELLTRALRSTDGIDPHAVAEAAAPRRRGRPSR
jgi:hypothetical protein